jgi:hypothetical protein
MATINLLLDRSDLYRLGDIFELTTCAFGSLRDGAVDTVYSSYIEGVMFLFQFWHLSYLEPKVQYYPSTVCLVHMISLAILHINHEFWQQY